MADQVRRNYSTGELDAESQTHPQNGDAFLQSQQDNTLTSQIAQSLDTNMPISSLPYNFLSANRSLPTFQTTTPNATSKRHEQQQLFTLNPPPRAQYDPNSLSPLSAVDSVDYTSPTTSDQLYASSAWDEYSGESPRGQAPQSSNASSFYNMHLRRASMQSDVSSFGGHSSAVSPFDSPLLEPQMSYQCQVDNDQLYLPPSSDTQQFDEALATIANSLGLEGKKNTPMTNDQGFVPDFSHYKLPRGSGSVDTGVSINIVPSSPTWRGGQQQSPPLEPSAQQSSPQPQPFIYRPEEQAQYNYRVQTRDDLRASSPNIPSPMPTIIVNNAPDIATNNAQGYDATTVLRRQRALSESYVVHSNTVPYDTSRRSSIYNSDLEDYASPSSVLLQPSNSSTPRQDATTPPQSTPYVDNRSPSHSSESGSSGQKGYLPMSESTSFSSPWPDHLGISSVVDGSRLEKSRKPHQRSHSVGYSPSLRLDDENSGPNTASSLAAATSAALRCGRLPSSGTSSNLTSPASRQSVSHASNFVCLYPDCNKRFTRAYNLRSHMRTHTKQRPFHCSICDQSFVRLHDMKRHEALHSGVKAFVCQGVLKSGAPWGCGRRFARQDALSRHFLKSASGKQCVKPFLDEMGLSTDHLERRNPDNGDTTTRDQRPESGKLKLASDLLDNSFWEQFGKQEM